MLGCQKDGSPTYLRFKNSYFKDFIFYTLLSDSLNLDYSATYALALISEKSPLEWLTN